MKIPQLLLLIILVVPLAEIYLLLQVGSFIGAVPTVVLVIFTAVLGSFLLRQQGFATFRRFQESLAKGEVPAYEIVEGPLILLGGLLLLTPGFITDIMGIVCLIPPLRKKVAQYVIEHYMIQTGSFGETVTTKTNVLEGEFRREE
jgi:UPF0716 protein FxsA